MNEYPRSICYSTQYRNFGKCDLHGVHIGDRSVFREVEGGRICTWETGMIKQHPGSTAAVPMDSYWCNAQLMLTQVSLAMLVLLRFGQCLESLSVLYYLTFILEVYSSYEF